VKRVKKPSLKINALSNWASLFVHIAVGFFLTPFVISHLGKSGYGIWVLVGSFIGYYGLLNLGVESAITRYIARYSAQNDTKSLNETANTALVMFCITGLLAIVLSFLVAEPLSRFFKVTPEHFTEFKQIIWVLGISTGLSFPSGVFGAMVTARERYVAVNIVNILVTLLRTGLTVVILLAGHGLAGIAYPTLAATVVSIIAFVLLSKKVVPEFHIQPSLASKANLKMLLVYGGITTVLVVTDILRFKIDSIVIGRMIGMSEVGIYGVAALLIQYMLKVVVAGMGVLNPRFAALDGAGKQQELQSTFLRSLSVSSFIACGIGLMALLFGRSFIFLWVGSDFETTVFVLWILAVAWVFDLAQNPGIGLMYSLNQHRYYAAATLVEATANVLLSILLARNYVIVGVAFGTAIPMVFMKVFIQPIYVSRIAKISIKLYLKAILPAFGVSGILLGVYLFLVYLLKINLETNSYLYLMLSIGIWGVGYCALNVLMSFTIRRFFMSSIPLFGKKMKLDVELRN